MAKQEGQRSKLLALLRIFQTQTDDQHRLNVPQLIDKLAEQGIPCERKSVYSDIDVLNTLGYTIELQRGRGGGYWLSHRTFDLAELKLLVDAVQSSRIIPEKKSRALIHKLEGLCSRYEAVQLQRQVYVSGRPKSTNQQLLYSVDALHNAIGKGVQVRFQYKKADASPTQRVVSPWQLAWENHCYYLIAYQDGERPGIRHFRVDRMENVRLLNAPRLGKQAFRDFDLPAYLKKQFGMYGGPEVRVTLRCHNSLRDAMAERFGAEPVWVPEDDGGHFHFDVPVFVSDQFFGWVCGFGGKMEITAPASVRAQLHDKAQSIAQAHEAIAE
ncbi:MAG: helix-turn-helix transcriptional regulator [Faecalibacterium sp.]